VLRSCGAEVLQLTMKVKVEAKVKAERRKEEGGKR
jgi:hypothetical protein